MKMTKLAQTLKIKIPAIPEGLKAMKKLSSDGYKVTATAIYTPIQAYLAAKAGADVFVSGNAIFSSDDRKGTIEKFKKIAEENYCK